MVRYEDTGPPERPDDFTVGDIIGADPNNGPAIEGGIADANRALHDSPPPGIDIREFDANQARVVASSRRVLGRLTELGVEEAEPVALQLAALYADPNVDDTSVDLFGVARVFSRKAADAEDQPTRQKYKQLSTLADAVTGLAALDAANQTHETEPFHNLILRQAANDQINYAAEDLSLLPDTIEALHQVYEETIERLGES